MPDFVAAGTAPFWIAFAIVAGLLAVELASLLVGASASGLIEDGLGFDGDGIGAWLSWLNAGGVPILVLFCVWLGSFAIAGFALQEASGAIGGPLPTLVAAALSAAAAIPATRLASRAIGRLIPHEETSAVTPEELVGLLGTVSIGPLDQGVPGRVRVLDAHGNYHELRARSGEGTIPERAKILVVDLNKADGTYTAIPEPDEIGRITKALGG